MKAEDGERCFNLCAAIASLKEEAKHHSGPWMLIAPKIRELTEILTKAAVLEEREGCAKVADNAAGLFGGTYGGPGECEYGCDGVIAAAIRARE